MRVTAILSYCVNGRSPIRIPRSGEGFTDLLTAHRCSASWRMRTPSNNGSTSICGRLPRPSSIQQPLKMNTKSLTADYPTLITERAAWLLGFAGGVTCPEYKKDE